MMCPPSWPLPLSRRRHCRSTTTSSSRDEGSSRGSTSEHRPESNSLYIDIPFIILLELGATPRADTPVLPRADTPYRDRLPPERSLGRCRCTLLVCRGHTTSIAQEAFQRRLKGRVCIARGERPIRLGGS